MGGVIRELYQVVSTSQRVALWVTLVGVIAVAGYWYIEKRNERSAAVRRTEEAADIARAKAGPYVEFNKTISPTEKLTIVVIPHPWGAWLDKRCLIYLNTEHKTSAMNCAFESLPPDVTR